MERERKRQKVQDEGHYAEQEAKKHAEQERKRQKVQDAGHYAEREAKKRKVQEGKRESGAGSSVEQLKNHRALLALTLTGEQCTCIGSALSVNGRHPEDNAHHAAKVLNIFYDPVTSALQNGIEKVGCRPPTMVAINVTKNFHEQIVIDTQANGR